MSTSRGKVYKSITETKLWHILSLPYGQDDGGVKCKCPAGFKGDGVKNCEGEIY